MRARILLLALLCSYRNGKRWHLSELLCDFEKVCVDDGYKLTEIGRRTAFHKWVATPRLAVRLHQGYYQVDLQKLKQVIDAEQMEALWEEAV